MGLPEIVLQLHLFHACTPNLVSCGELKSINKVEKFSFKFPPAPRESCSLRIYHLPRECPSVRGNKSTTFYLTARSSFGQKILINGNNKRLSARQRKTNNKKKKGKEASELGGRKLSGHMELFLWLKAFHVGALWKALSALHSESFQRRVWRESRGKVFHFERWIEE